MGMCLIADVSAVEQFFITLWVIFKVAAGLGFVIFVHELGHFLVAKACGVKCEKFYVGFDAFEIKLGPVTIPRSLWKTQWGETEYGIGILPLGGYVKMLGQDDNPAHAEEEAARIRKPRHANDEEPASDDAAESPPTAEPGTDAADGTAATSAAKTTGSERAEEDFELDPRSYPAKSVPARMAIISAGVIMNLIFAVVFSAIAFRVGVDIQPAVVGATVPGDPAWVAGFEPGDKIIQIGRDGQPSENLRYVKDLVRKVMLNGSDKPMDLLVRRQSTGEEEWITVTPSNRLSDDMVLIGITSAPSLKLSQQAPIIPYLPAGQTDKPLMPGDEITAVDGKPLSSGFELQEILANDKSSPLTLTVQRWPDGSKPEQRESGAVKPESLDVVLPPFPTRKTGINVEFGPISAIRKGSPAEAAGLQVGDVLEKVNGQTVTNASHVSDMLLPLVGQQVALEILRGGDPKTIEVTPVRPEVASQNLGGAPEGVEPIGIALPVSETIGSVDPDSPAAEAGLQAGDVILSVQFDAIDEKQKAMIDSYLPKFDEPVELSDKTVNWETIHTYLQSLPEDVRIKLTYRRGETQHVATLGMNPSTEYYNAYRGLPLAGLSQTHQELMWGNAWRLGFRETKEQSLTVIGILGRLVTGKLSFKNLSGPVGILRVAGIEASKGIPELLIFLTLLSANLAVLNFLPIPALDGGHMMFLFAEFVRGKPVDEQLQMKLSFAGIILLLMLIVSVTFLDIGRFFQ